MKMRVSAWGGAVPIDQPYSVLLNTNGNWLIEATVQGISTIRTLVSVSGGPTAVSTAPVACVQEGTPNVTLDGSTSSNANDYSWVKTNSGPGPTLDLTDPSKPTFTAPNVGNNGRDLEYTLTVRDTDGSYDVADPVTIHVHNTGNPGTCP